MTKIFCKNCAHWQDFQPTETSCAELKEGTYHPVSGYVTKVEYVNPLVKNANFDCADYLVKDTLNDIMRTAYENATQNAYRPRHNQGTLIPGLTLNTILTETWKEKMTKIFRNDLF